MLTKKNLAKKETLLLGKFGITGQRLANALDSFNQTITDERYKTPEYFIKYCLSQQKNIRGSHAHQQQQMSINWQPSRACVQDLINSHYLEELIHFEIDAFIVSNRETTVSIDLDASFKAWVKQRLVKMTAPCTLAHWVASKPLRAGSVINAYSNSQGIHPTLINEYFTLYCKSQATDHKCCHDSELLALLKKHIKKTPSHRHRP